MTASTSAGEDMTISTFKKIVDLMSGRWLIFFGGEPTLHPNFEEMLEISKEAGVGVSVITNGSHKRRSLKMYDVMQREKSGNRTLAAIISSDEFHDQKMVDVEVREKYTKMGLFKERVTGTISLMGRGSTFFNEVHSSEHTYVFGKHCGIGGVFDVNGDVKACLCADSRVIGNVHKSKVSLTELRGLRGCSVY